MSSLYKRQDSHYYWWTTRYKGRRLRLSTKMTQRHHARKVQSEWDLRLMLGKLDFLGLQNQAPIEISRYVNQYLGFIESRKSENTFDLNRSVLKRFESYLGDKSIDHMDQITVRTIDGYLDSLDNSPKTKKNYLGLISLMMQQAIKEGVINNNPAKMATLPQMVTRSIHRQLDSIDLKIIFEGAGSWSLYYSFLYYTGLRAGDAAMLTYGKINRSKKAIVGFVRKSRRIHEFPLADNLLNMIPNIEADVPIFPTIYTETERKLNWKITKARKYMQLLLEANNRPKATLHSFRVTYNNTLRDLGLSIEDRQILLAHSSSETTKIYTHPNFNLAQEFVNKIPVYDKKGRKAATIQKRDQNVTK